jgi:negative regulator of sigma E activity
VACADSGSGSSRLGQAVACSVPEQEPALILLAAVYGSSCAASQCSVSPNKEAVVWRSGGQPVTAAAGLTAAVAAGLAKASAGLAARCILSMVAAAAAAVAGSQGV